MVELNEPVMVGLFNLLDSQNQQSYVSCEWRNCTVNHSKKPIYPNNGITDKNNSYSQDWVNAKLEPWDKYGPGIDSRATLADYKNETENASYTVNAAALKHPQYHTQKHHLISVNLFKKLSDLNYNSILIGYDVNHKKNGICLPSYKVDIVRHELQCHRGNHPNDSYYAKVIPLLEEAEKRCLKYCHVDFHGNSERQKQLINDLNKISDRTEAKINNWQWLLRSHAIDERKESKEKLSNR